MLKNTEEPNEPKKLADKPLAYGFVVCFGVLLPLITLIVELSTNLCAEAFFDPVPSLWHVLIVALVPVANAQLLWSLHKNRFEKAAFLAWISAISAGAAVFYSILFLPLSPIALLALLFAGIGLLPLSPFLALWAVLVLRKHLRRKTDAKPLALSWLGVLIGFLAVAAIVGLSESRFAVTRYGLAKANSADLEKQAEGIDFLRAYGSEDYILQLANSNRKRFYISEFLMPGERISTTEAKEIYYRLTGKTSDTTAVPTRFSFDDDEERFRRELEISLASSQMHASIDNEASLGYLEWTFSLQNSNPSRDLEGFTQIQLPPGGVVSRLTLWINGEEREAAFAGKSRVTNAYQQVTAKKRDPVLVTTAGRDRVNLKCFPIPQKGGEMKMRVGITFPLVPEDENNGLMRLPYFRDKNFRVPEAVNHTVQIESRGELESVNQKLKSETVENLFSLRGAFSDGELNDSSSSIRAVKSGKTDTVWTKNGDEFISQKVFEIPRVQPSRLVFVIDTSESMRADQAKLAAALRNLPGETEVSLVLTSGNALNRETGFPNSLTGQPSEIAERIERAAFGGGTDNLPALRKAWELASEKPNSAVIWVHAPQPFGFGTSAELPQPQTRQPNETILYSLSTANGLDLAEKSLNDLKNLEPVPRFGELEKDLERLLRQLNRSIKTFGYTREKSARFEAGNAPETSKHLVRLWAHDEVNRILATENDEGKAVRLAVQNQLVTAVTGAVVLETKEQYEQFGLHPVDKNTVPTIPEPEFYLLLAVILGVFVWLFATRKLF